MDPDYERLWKIVNQNNRDRYSAYQDKERVAVAGPGLVLGCMCQSHFQPKLTF